MTYTFDFVDMAGRIDHFQLHHCIDHVDAVRVAEAELRGSLKAIAVEVWCDTSQVARISLSARSFA